MLGKTLRFLYLFLCVCVLGNCSGQVSVPRLYINSVDNLLSQCPFALNLVECSNRPRALVMFRLFFHAWQLVSFPCDRPAALTYLPHRSRDLGERSDLNAASKHQPYIMLLNLILAALVTIHSSLHAGCMETKVKLLA